MEIAFFTGVFPKLSETFIINQVTGLLDRGHEVTVFADQMPRENREHDVVAEYNLRERTVVVPSPASLTEGVTTLGRLLPRTIGRFPDATPHVLRALATGMAAPDILGNIHAFLAHGASFDVCHAHFGHIGKRWAFVSRLPDQGPFVTTFYGWDVSTHPHPDDYDVYEPFWPACDLCLGITNHVVSRCVLLGANEGKCRKHPLGVSTSSFDADPQSPAGQTLQLATVARHVEKKGLRYAIDAVADCIDRGVDLEYQIAGDGPLRADLEAQIDARCVSDRVTLLGWQTQSEVRSLLQDAHVFVLPSVTASDGDMEGQALVLQEAQAMGVPVISTYHDGIPEGVAHRETGLLVPERDPGALADAIETFAADPSMVESYGRQARRLVEERFDNRDLVARQEELYRDLMAGRIP